MSVSLNNANTLLNTVNSENDTHRAATNNPHGVTANQVDAYTKSEVDGFVNNAGNMIWTATGQIGCPALVDNMVFYPALRGSEHYAIFQVNLDGHVKSTIINGKNWPYSTSSTNGTGFRASIYADWENATATTIDLYASWEHRVAKWTYNRVNQTCTSLEKHHVNNVGTQYGRGWSIYGMGTGSHPTFFMRYDQPNNDWNNIRYYRIARTNYHETQTGGQFRYSGAYKWCGSSTNSTIVSDDGSQIYSDSLNYYPFHAGIGVNGNRAFYAYNGEYSMLHRFIVPGTNNCADDLWASCFDNSSTTTANLNYDRSFQVPNISPNPSTVFQIPMVQFDDNGNEVGIAVGLLSTEGGFRYPRVGICRWNPEWGTGVP